MPETNWLFLYTPIPYLAAMYFVAYRHDLGRLARPFRDFSSKEKWYSVCKELGLAGLDVNPPRESFAGGKLVSALYAVSTIFYGVAAYASFFVPWYFTCALQAGVAALLFAMLVTVWTGPFPFRPYRDVLPYPRLGRRIRHLGGRREPKADHPKEVSISTTGGPT